MYEIHRKSYFTKRKELLKRVNTSTNPFNGKHKHFNSNCKPYKDRSHNELLTKVDVMPAKAPAASLPTTESSPFFPWNIFCKSKSIT